MILFKACIATFFFGLLWNLLSIYFQIPLAISIPIGGLIGATGGALGCILYTNK